MYGESEVIICGADIGDIDIIAEYDKHISFGELKNIIELNRVYKAEIKGNFAGWLRYNLFWDNTPFINMIYVMEEYRDKDLGKKLVEVCEKSVKNLGYNLIMTSSSQEELGQHFFVKLGYRAIGGFIPEGEPYEIIFIKEL